MRKILYLGKSISKMPDSGQFIEHLKSFGELTLIRNADSMPIDERISLIHQSNILLIDGRSLPVPENIADDKGNLEYICGMGGHISGVISQKLIDTGIPVTNWGDAPSDSVAEGAVALLLAALKDLHAHTKTVRENGWKLDMDIYPGGTLKNLDVGVYGFGVIGKRFVELIRSFRPVIRIYDPYVKEIPEDCIRVDSLDELFSYSKAIVIHAALCDGTRNSVTADLLARLPDKGIIVNTARGDIIDHDALFAELEKGRLRAALDVLPRPDRLPENHPARLLENCIFTAHSISGGSWGKPSEKLARYQEICIENIRRHIDGEPLLFIMDRDRYMIST